MARKTASIVIDGVTFEITQLGAVEGSDLYARLAAAIGPTIADGPLAGLADSSAEAKIAALAIKGLAGLPTELWTDLRIKFAGTTKVQAGEVMLTLGDGRTLPAEGTFDQHFAGRYGHMTRWLMACLKHNFADFLPISVASAAADKKPTQ